MQAVTAQRLIFLPEQSFVSTKCTCAPYEINHVTDVRWPPKPFTP